MCFFFCSNDLDYYVSGYCNYSIMGTTNIQGAKYPHLCLFTDKNIKVKNKLWFLGGSSATNKHFVGWFKWWKKSYKHIDPGKK